LLLPYLQSKLHVIFIYKKESKIMAHKRMVYFFMGAWFFAIGMLVYVQKTQEAVVSAPAAKCRVGLLIVATGRYIHMADELIKSAQRHFCKNHEVTYFVFTDGTPEPPLPIDGRSAQLVKIDWQQQGWPYDTMMRFHAYRQNKDKLAAMDYVYAVDADMLFVDTVGDEILSDLVGVRHSQFMFKRGGYDTNPLSTACVNRNEGKTYFVGAFYGGKRDEFFALLDTITENITTDLSRGVIARQHDESHLNRYFIDHEPTLVLSPSYCHFEAWPSPYPKKLIAFDRPIHDNKVRKQVKISPLAYVQKLRAQEISGGDAV
jgi:histo-blood group ABO system transferase